MEQLKSADGSTRQRTVRTEDQILSLISEYEKSGYTIKDFCEVSDVNEATFYTWLKKYRIKPEDEVKGFATIEVVPSSAVRQRPVLFAEVGNIRLYKEVPPEYLKALVS
jgi:transposase-like protein